MTSLAAISILMGVPAGDVHAKGLDLPVKALYGLSLKEGAFRGKPPGQIAQTLEQWGITAVFGGYKNSSLVAALHARGIQVFAEVGLFVGKNYWKRYPHSRPIASTGKPMDPEGSSLSYLTRGGNHLPGLTGCPVQLLNPSRFNKLPVRIRRQRRIGEDR